MKDNFTPYERADLLLRDMRGELAEEERSALQRWLAERPERQAFVERLQTEQGMSENYAFLSEVNQPEAWAVLRQAIQVDEDNRPGALRSWWSRSSMIWKVAVAVVAITLGVWLYYSSFNPFVMLSLSKHASSLRAQRGNLNDIAPGRNTATLTLASGEVIKLDTNKSSLIATDSLKNIDPSKLGMTNVVQTPRGGTYQVTLPDGTRVWLNADSKIEFPSQFIGKERKVFTEGEVYFEVVKNEAKPFIVTTAQQKITVLGTHFNINSYADEKAIKTTLLEGSVRINNDVTLKPNQQAVLIDHNKIQIKQVDPLESIAWQRGNFLFENEDIQSVMRKIARWYDVEVVFEAGTEGVRLGGTVSRFSKVSKVLDMLEETGAIKFKIEGRRVYVKK